MAITELFLERPKISAASQDEEADGIHIELSSEREVVRTVSSKSEPAKFHIAPWWREEADPDPFRKPPVAEVQRSSPSLSTVLNKQAALIRQGKAPLATNEEWNAGVAKSFQELEETSRIMNEHANQARP